MTADAISDEQIYSLLESAHEDYSGVSFKSLDSRRASQPGGAPVAESRKELQRGSIYPVVENDPQLKRLLSVLK